MAVQYLVLPDQTSFCHKGELEFKLINSLKFKLNQHLLLVGESAECWHVGLGCQAAVVPEWGGQA